MAVLIYLIFGFWILVEFSGPILSWRGWLVAGFASAAAGVLAAPWTRTFFALDLPGPAILVEATVMSLFGITLLRRFGNRMF